MAKEKRRIEVEDEKMYFYEISATIVILFSLVTFSELGFVGRGLKSVLQILFGDYYFVLVLYLIGHGIYALVKRRWFDFTSIKFNGFIIFLVSLISLNHLGFYERLGFSNDEIFSKSLTTYANTLKNLIQLNSYGGGLVGALFVQVLIFLFNQIGTLVILIVFLVLSLSFMTNLSYKTLLYYIQLIYKKIRTTFVLLYKYFKNIKFPTKTIKKAKLNLNLNINMLDDYDNKANEAIAHKMALSDQSEIRHYLNSIGAIVSNQSLNLGYIATRYTYDCSKITYDKEVLKKITNSNIIVTEGANRIVVESVNKVKRLLTLKHLLLNTTEIPLGLEVDNTVITFDGIKHKNLLLTGGIESGIKTQVKAFIVSNIFKYRYDFNLVILDYKQEFLELKYMPNLLIPYNQNNSEFIKSLEYIATHLESRIEMINKAGYQNYIEYNKLEEEKIKVIYVILNSIDSIREYAQKKEAKLLYFLKFGFKVGIHFIIINRNFGIDKEILANIQTKLVYKCTSTPQSYELLQNNNGCLLDNKSDCIITLLDQTYRITTPYISKSDYDKVITKYICN